MANKEHFDLLKQGVEVWNQWRKQCPDIQPDLSRGDLSKATLRLANLSRANLSWADLGGTDLNESDLSHANLEGANLSESFFRNANLVAANLGWVKGERANFSEAKFRHAIMSVAQIYSFDDSYGESLAVYGNFNEASFEGADLSYVNLYKVDFPGANLRKAFLRRSTLSNADLKRADLQQADLVGVDLSTAYLSEANLSKADLQGANLSRAKMDRVNLRGADLQGANLSGAKMEGANLTSATLLYANFYGSDLNTVNFSEAEVESTIFAENDLSMVKGLLKINHKGPSRVELHTVKLPPDGRAWHFLRGAGIPDEWIDFYRAQMMHPIQYHSCFISYSSKDGTLAQRLHADLQAQGVRCWFAPEDMKIGDKIRSRIDEAIHLQDKLLLILSKHSLASNWVEIEVEAALEKEQRQGREVLFPVSLDESVMQTSQAWAKQLRRARHIGDFTNWTDPQAYEQAFERLLHDLKAQE